MIPKLTMCMDNKSQYNSERKKFFIRFCTNEDEKGIELLCFVVDEIEGLSKCRIYEARVSSEEESSIKIDLYDRHGNRVDSLIITEDLIIKSSKEFECLVEREGRHKFELKEVIRESCDYVINYNEGAKMIYFYKTKNV